MTDNHKIRAIAQKAAQDCALDHSVRVLCLSCVESAIREAVGQAEKEIKNGQNETAQIRRAYLHEKACKEAAEQERDALRARVAQLEASMVSHFQRQHLDGDGPEIDRWRARVAELSKYLREAITTLENANFIADTWKARAEQALASASEKEGERG